MELKKTYGEFRAMLTAHLPSGYILGRIFAGRSSGRAIMPAAFFGAVIPDIDMLYFHFVDIGQTHHHMFVSHWPLFWLALAFAVILVAHIAGRGALQNAAVAFFAAVMLHLALDSIAAPIFWLLPFGEGRVELVRVPAHYSHWIISYLLHWTFALELTIWALAFFIFGRARR